MCVALGVMGLAYVGVVFVLVVRNAPEWIGGATVYYAANSVIAAPLYVLSGSIVLLLSRRLAKFVAKHAQPEGDPGSARPPMEEPDRRPVDH